MNRTQPWRAGQSATQRFRVSAGAPKPNPSPVIAGFNTSAGSSAANPLSVPSIAVNQSCNLSEDSNFVSLSWATNNLPSDDNSSLSISESIGTLPGNVYTSGSVQYYDLLANTTFVMNAVNINGATSSSLPVYVATQQSSASISNFSATSSGNNSVSLSWSVSSGVAALWLGAYTSDVDVSTLGNLNTFDPSIFTNLSKLAANNQTTWTVNNVALTTQFVLFAQDIVGPYAWYPNGSTSNTSLVVVQ